MEEQSLEYVIGILLILTFFALGYYCVKGYNLMIGFLLITIVWTVLPLAGTLFVSEEFLAANPVLQFGGDSETKLVSVLNAIYQSAPEGWGSTLVNVCWGAWFGRVLMDTGIASTIIRKTVELGGRPADYYHCTAGYCDRNHFHGHDGGGPGNRHRRHRAAHSYVPGNSQGHCHVYLYVQRVRRHVSESGAARTAPGLCGGF